MRVSKTSKENVVNGVEQLKKEFSRTVDQAKLNYRQVYHENGWYIYMIDFHNYEVFKEKITNSVKLENGKLVSDLSVKKVKYPNDEDFGRWAWSCMSFEHAMKYVKTR